jgi:hypothetical protein
MPPVITVGIPHPVVDVSELSFVLAPSVRNPAVEPPLLFLQHGLKAIRPSVSFFFHQLFPIFARTNNIDSLAVVQQLAHFLIIRFQRQYQPRALNGLGDAHAPLVCFGRRRCCRCWYPNLIWKSNAAGCQQMGKLPVLSP